MPTPPIGTFPNVTGCESPFRAGPVWIFEDHDDWASVHLRFRNDGDSADGAIEPADDSGMPSNEQEPIQALRDQERTDLTLDARATFDILTLSVTNHGPVDANDLRATIDLPAGVTIDGPGCATTGSVAVCAIASRLLDDATTSGSWALHGTTGTSTFIATVTSYSNPVGNDPVPQDNTVTFNSRSEVGSPVVVGHIQPVPNSAGWNNTAVIVDWQATDPAPSSGTPTDPPNTLIDSIGADQHITSEPSCDPAGNCTIGQVVVSIDATPPDFDATREPAPNEAGWNNTSVQLTYACADDLSGVPTCPEPATVASEGAQQYVSTSIVDAAGNATSLTTNDINIDRTPPTLTLQAPPNGGVVQEPEYVPPTCTASDNLSGLDGVCSVFLYDQTAVGDGYTVTAEAFASDLAGNTTTVSSTYTVVSDSTGPTIYGASTPTPNPAGWWKQPATFSFTCSDASGVASCPAPVTVSTEGVNETFDVTATDSVGNVSTLTVSGVNIDRTAPTIVTTAPATVTPLDTVTVTCAATDQRSGIATATCADSTFPATELSPGPNVFTFTATDVAGNTTSKTVTVTLQVPSNPAPSVRADMGITTLEDVGFQTRAVAIVGSFNDSNGPGPYTASVRWDSTGPFTPFILNNDRDFVAAWIYPTAATHTVTVKICDANGACGTDNVTVRSAVTQKITPVPQCVADRGASTNPRYQAMWGYNNPAPFAIVVPSVPLIDNTFTGAPFLRGQPQIFLPGNRRNVFTSGFASGTVTWKLNAQTAAANASSIRCT